MRKRLADAAALMVLLAPAALLAARLATRGLECGVLINPFDVRLVNYLLEWGYQHLVEGVAPGNGLWSPPFFYPARHVLGYSDTYISAYPFYFAGRLLGASPAAALLVYQLSQLALTAVVAYLCARWIGFGRLTSFLFAQCFAWGWPRYNQLAHLQFASGWVVPLFYTSLYLAIRRRQPWLLAIVTWTVCDAFYTSAYVAYFLLLTAAIAAALITIQLRRLVFASIGALTVQVRSWPGPVIALWSATVVAPLLLGAVGVYEYRLAVHQVGLGDPQELFTYQASLWSWIRPEGDGLLWRRFSDLFPPDVVAPWEKQFFLGWITLACVIFALVSRRATPEDGPLSRVAARAAAGTVLLSILLVSHFPLRPLNWPFIAAVKLLPGFTALRASGRIALVIAALSTLVAAAVIDTLRRTRPFPAGIAAALFLLENLTPLPALADRCEAERPWKALEPRLCEASRNSGAGTVLFLPMDAISFDRIFGQVPEMTLALGCGIATINGYSGREAPKVAPLFHGDPSRFDCSGARDVVDAARQESGKSVLIYLEESGPLGPPGYSPAEVAGCFRTCIAATAAIQVEKRRGTTLTIGAQLPCGLPASH